MAAPPATVLVVDAKPISLLATAGALHHAGMQCVCARDESAAKKALGLSESDTGDGIKVARVDPAQQPIVDPSSSAKDSDLAQDAGEGNLPAGQIETVVWEVADNPQLVLDAMHAIRAVPPWSHLPFVLLAQSRWAGLEKKIEHETAPTRCLYSPIDPNVLIEIVQQLLWMPSLQAVHRTRGSRPGRVGWVTLD